MKITQHNLITAIVNAEVRAQNAERIESQRKAGTKRSDFWCHTCRATLNRHQSITHSRHGHAVR